MQKSSIVTSPIFIPRLTNQDGIAVTSKIGNLPGVLVTANLAASSRYKKLTQNARKTSKIFIIDPMTNHLLYDSFTEKSTFQQIPYAPKTPFDTAKLLSDEKFRIAKLVEPSINFQIDLNADVIIIPYFFSEDATGDKFRLNHTLIADSVKYAKRRKIDKPLFAMINIGNSALSNLKMLNQIIDRYMDRCHEFDGYFVMIDNLHDIKADEDALKGIAWLVFQLSQSKDVFVLSIGAFGEVLSTIGASGFSSGLAWLETFSEKNLKQTLKFSPRKKKVSQTYIPELFDYVNDEIVKLINYKCSCASCKGKIPADPSSKKLHFLYRRLEGMKKLAGLNKNERIGVMKARLEEALELAEGLYEKFAIPLQTVHLSKWMRVLDSAKRWKRENQNKAVADLDRLIYEARSK